VTSGDFDVGYVQGTKVIHIRNRLDIQEFWQNFKKGSLMLWYDGLNKSKSNETEHIKNKRELQATKDQDVQNIVEKLITKHGTNFTTMQLRIWEQMINCGLHSSYENPPTTSMLSRADFASKKSGPSVNQGVVDAATAITSSFTKATSIPSRCSSPSELIETL